MFDEEADICSVVARRRRIPGPSALQVLFDLLPVPFKRFPKFLPKAVLKYGNVLALDLPWRRYVFINDARLARDVLVTQQHEFSKSPDTHVLGLLLGDGLLTSEEPLHRRMRRIVQPAFHRDRIAGYAKIMEADANDYAARLDDAEIIDIHQLMTELTLKIASKTLFGTDESELARQVSQALHDIMEQFPYMLTPLASLKMRLPLPGKRRFESAKRTLDRIVYSIIDRKRASASTGTDALSLLLSAAAAESEPLPDEQIRDEIMTLFLAGHETTANALTWTFYLLSLHAEIDDRVGLAAAQGDNEYLSRVIRESMRLYPPAWIIGRKALRDVTLVDGTSIESGTTVFMAQLLLHRQPEYYSEPEVFDPNRWLTHEPEPCSYIPFGAGARRCIGEDFAWKEATIVLRAFARKYSFVQDKRIELALDPLVTLRPAGPVRMRPIRRADS